MYIYIYICEFGDELDSIFAYLCTALMNIFFAFLTISCLIQILKYQMQRVTVSSNLFVTFHTYLSILFFANIDSFCDTQMSEFLKLLRKKAPKTYEVPCNCRSWFSNHEVTYFFFRFSLEIVSYVNCTISLRKRTVV